MDSALIGRMHSHIYKTFRWDCTTIEEQLVAWASEIVPHVKRDFVRPFVLYMGIRNGFDRSRRCGHRSVWAIFDNKYFKWGLRCSTVGNAGFTVATIPFRRVSINRTKVCSKVNTEQFVQKQGRTSCSLLTRATMPAAASCACVFSFCCSFSRFPVLIIIRDIEHYFGTLETNFAEHHDQPHQETGSFVPQY